MVRQQRQYEVVLVWLTALLSALCFCPISLKIGGQRLGLILTFIEATKGKSGLRANNKTLETLSKLNQEKKVILKVFFFIGSQLIKCMYFHNTNLPALTFQMFSTERSIEHWSGFWWLLVLLLWDSDTYLCQIPLELSHMIDKGFWCLRLHLKADLSVLYSTEERPRLYLKIWHLAGGKVSPRPILRLAEACPAQRLKVQNAFKSHF